MEIDKTAGLQARRVEPASRPVGRGPSGGRGRWPGGFGGRGNQGALVTPGRYRATLGRQVGETVTPLGQPQVFQVVQCSRLCKCRVQTADCRLTE